MTTKIATDNGGDTYGIGDEVLVVYPQGDCDTARVLDITANSITVMIGSKVTFVLPEDVIALDAGSFDENCGDSKCAICVENVSTDARLTIDICGDCWETSRPDEYFPSGDRFGICGICGYDAFVVRTATNRL